MPRHRTRKTKSPRQNKRWVIALVIGLLALALLAIVGYDSFRTFRIRRLTARANAFLEVGDLKSAALTGKSIIQLDRHALDAFRILARVAEQNGERTALDWRQQAVAEAPNSLSDGIALARVAIKFHELSVAENTLNRIAPRASQEASFHGTIGALYLARKDRPAAEKEYGEAIRLDPTNDEYRLVFATLQLGSSSDDARSAARKALRELVKRQPVRVAAARILLEDAVNRKDPELLSFAKLLFESPEATLQDRIRYVEITSRLGLSAFPGALTSVQDEAALDPSKLTAVLSWMSENHEAVLAIEWAKRLPPESLEQRPVFVALADCFAAASDCRGLMQWVKKFGWKDLEYLRHAYLAYADRTCNDSPGSELEWTKALQAANHIDTLMTLQRAAAKWGWKKESIALLWELAKERSQQTAALATLNEYYNAEADTNNLYKVSSRLVQVSPNDPVAKNNFAQLSLLLGVNTEGAEAIARELHNQSPKDASFASTYAFALYVKGKLREALKIMNSLPEEDLRRPEIAAYYGIILAASGDRNRAAAFLELGREAKLLPEEKALLEKATGTLSSIR